MVAFQSRGSWWRGEVRIRIWLIAAFVVFFVLVPTLARWYTDWLWFGEVGYRRVFWVPLLSRIGVTTIAAAAVLLLVWPNLRPFLRVTESKNVIDLEPGGGGRWASRRAARRVRSSGIVVGGLAAVAFITGVSASARWPMFQQFVHARPFGAVDPLFGRDIGFFAFRLPVYRFIESWMFSWLVVVFLAVAAGYYFRHASEMVQGVWTLPPGPRAHLSLLAGCVLLVRGWGFWLDVFDLEYSPGGAIVGASYTDVHAVLPALRALTILFVVCAGLMFANVRLRTFRLAALTVLVIAVAWTVGLGVVPGLVQQLRVAPNELTVETPYIRNSITATLRAFRLDHLQEGEFSADPVTPEIAARNRATIENVRLWDYRPLLSAYQQLQGLRPYYVFGDVDIDRYRLAGVQRQVMLAARELDPTRLTPQARTWVNEHLVYTHGYGLVMSPVNRVSEEGMPDFFLKDIPPTGRADLAVQRPQIYFGEHTDRYVIINTRVQELDYPRGDANVYTTYQGRGGVRLTPLRRLAFAYRFGDARLLLSSDISTQSRLLFARELLSRVRRIAPLLSYDQDPYLVVAGGGLKWIVDAYTTRDRYPYATPVRRSTRVSPPSSLRPLPSGQHAPLDGGAQRCSPLRGDRRVPVPQGPARLRADAGGVPHQPGSRHLPAAHPVESGGVARPPRQLADHPDGKRPDVCRAAVPTGGAEPAAGAEAGDCGQRSPHRDGGDARCRGGQAAGCDTPVPAAAGGCGRPANCAGVDYAGGGRLSPRPATAAAGRSGRVLKGDGARGGIATTA